MENISWNPQEMKNVKLEKLSAKVASKLFKRAAFSQFVKSRLVQDQPECGGCQKWLCCGQMFSDFTDINKHVSVSHVVQITEIAELLRQSAGDKKSKKLKPSPKDHRKYFHDKFHDYQCLCEVKTDEVLLFYHYVDIEENLEHIKTWQEEVGRKLTLTGKIRLSTEGINGTLEGCRCATAAYKDILCHHHQFCKMKSDDFKSSSGTGQSFSGFIVTICQELCTLGVKDVDFALCERGVYMTPEEFHHTLMKMQSSLSEEEDAPLLLDIRNFYESRIGCFEGAIKPDLRKFSYFQEYVDCNREMFLNRRVLTYCTGGIRCERASAYLKNATDCAEVYQLQGGIHKYLEKYPRGFFRGKLFVFDNRYSIGTSTDIVSHCFYCETPHDAYQLCSTQGCRQLVLICERCRSDGRTTCCDECARNSQQVSHTKQCACTRGRLRAPVEHCARDVVDDKSDIKVLTERSGKREL